MISDRFVAELRSVLQAQHHILHKLDVTVTDIEEKLADVSQQSQDIQELEKMMAELEASIDFLDADDFSDFNADEILQLYDRRRAAVNRELVKIGFKDWDSFVRQCQIYALQQQLDPLAPYEAFLTEADLKKLQNESYDAQYAWDKWDYIFVGASGVLAALTDFMLVKIPATMTSGEYSGQIGSPLTAWLKQYNIKKADDWFAQWARYLEEVCKVPYDDRKLIAGMYPQSHRFQSLGHDPVLGFIFGVLDIMRGTITGFSYDKLTGMHNLDIKFVQNSQPVGLIEAILKQIGHLISDVATPMGLPAPFMTLVQGINAGSFGEKGRTLGELSRWMYLNGYDFRHFLVSGITPAVIEIVLRGYIMLRHYSEHGETKFILNDHPKYRSMLLVAHSIAALGNAGKIALMQGNPLAFNLAEWMALIRYLLPSVKYWVFDEHRLRLEHMERINEAGWNELLQNSEKIVEIIASESSAIDLVHLPALC
ncbi:hypothetical protein ACE1CD_08740 [Aerosakkonema sp. BLCC-F183]|uniref:hypothetical protein n=1 Tax=Aerosakkonema sp. BLCC-F183 TaxID=3342834 RepID=UPI0035B9FB1D